MHGASGYITGPAAFWPEVEAQYWDLLDQGRYPEADKLHSKLGPFWQFFWHGGGLLKGEEFPGGGEGAYFGASVLKAALSTSVSMEGLSDHPSKSSRRSRRQSYSGCSKVRASRGFSGRYAEERATNPTPATQAV